MKTIEFNGKKYRISYDGSVEVYIPAGEPKVMRDAKRAYWRSLKPFSKLAIAVRKAAV